MESRSPEPLHKLPDCLHDADLLGCCLSRWRCASLVNMLRGGSAAHHDLATIFAGQHAYAYLTSNVLQQKVTRSSAVCTPLSRLWPHICARRKQGETGRLGFGSRGAHLNNMGPGWAPWAWRAGLEQQRLEQILRRRSAAPMPRRHLWPGRACAPQLLPPARAYMCVSTLFLTRLAPTTDYGS